MDQAYIKYIQEITRDWENYAQDDAAMPISFSSILANLWILCRTCLSVRMFGNGH